jgi:ribose 5-phosphate isomerase
VAAAIKGIPGVVDHGLFLDMSLEVVVGSASGGRFL